MSIEAESIEDLPARLTAVVGRICIDMLRVRKTRREETMESHVPDPISTAAESFGPEGETLSADSVGLALLVVLDTLTPWPHARGLLVEAAHGDHAAQPPGAAAQERRQRPEDQSCRRDQAQSARAPVPGRPFRPSKRQTMRQAPQMTALLVRAHPRQKRFLHPAWSWSWSATALTFS